MNTAPLHVRAFAMLFSSDSRLRISTANNPTHVPIFELGTLIDRYFSYSDLSLCNNGTLLQDPEENPRNRPEEDARPAEEVL
jgi:hypothetical protein